MSVEAYLHFKLNRRVTVAEAAELVGLSRSQYTIHRDRGTITADQVVQAMEAVGINPALALVEMGYLDKTSVIEAADEWDTPRPHDQGKGGTATKLNAVQ